MSTGPQRTGLAESSHVNVALAKDRMVLKYRNSRPRVHTRGCELREVRPWLWVGAAVVEDRVRDKRVR